MKKMKMSPQDLTQDNIPRIRELSPGCVIEGKGDEGQLTLAVDFDLLWQERPSATERSAGALPLHLAG